MALPMVDDFTIAQSIAIPGSGNNSSTVNNAAIFGGQRDFFGSRSTSAGATFVINSNDPGTLGLFTYSQSTNTVGLGRVTYPGGGDLTGGGQYNQLVIEKIGSDLAIDVEFTFNTTGGSGSQIFNIPFNSSPEANRLTLFIPFTDFGLPVSAFENVTSFEIFIPDNGESDSVDLLIDNIYVECVAVKPGVSITATPNPITTPGGQSNLCWTVTGPTTSIELNGNPVAASDCMMVGAGYYELVAENECEENSDDVTVTTLFEGACCTDAETGECEDGVLAEECVDGEFFLGETCMEIKDRGQCSPPPPPVVPAFNPLGLLVFAGLIPLSWVLVSRRKKN
jgi:hypothetical protein